MVATKQSSTTKTSRRRNWAIGTGAGLVAIAALVGGRDFGNIHGPGLDPKLIAWISAAVLLFFGFVAARRLAGGLGDFVSSRSVATAGSAVRMVVACLGYIIVVVSVFEVLGLGVAIDHVLVGAGFAGVVLGIAAQQSLGNFFAALMLLFSRPFQVGDHIRIRSGALGGVFDAYVLEVSLVYVSLRTDEGQPLKIPNAAMLAAGIIQLPGALPAAAATGEEAAPPPGATRA
jgi:small-conductance mechanosensitive channel